MLWWPFLVFSRLQRCSTKLFGLVYGWQWMGNDWDVDKGYKLQYACGIGCCKEFRQVRLGAPWLDESDAVLVGSRSNLFEAPKWHVTWFCDTYLVLLGTHGTDKSCFELTTTIIFVPLRGWKPPIPQWLQLPGTILVQFLSMKPSLRPNLLELRMLNFCLSRLYCRRLNPKRIIFPEYDPDAWKTGDQRSASRDISIDKHVSRDFSLLAPEVEEFLRRALIYLDFVLPSKKLHHISIFPTTRENWKII